jgi:hypothetical protein
MQIGLTNYKNHLEERSIASKISFNNTPYSECNLPRKNHTRESMPVGLRNNKTHLVERSIASKFSFNNTPYSECNLPGKNHTHKIHKQQNLKGDRFLSRLLARTQNLS